MTGLSVFGAIIPEHNRGRHRIKDAGGLMAKRLALITGGMGGLGEIISTKMSDAGYRVAVTHSPSNKTADGWTAQMKSRGYEFRTYPCDVADFESCKSCVGGVTRDLGPVKILPQIPLGRLGRPEEVAGLIIYLCSEEAAFVNGANIAINGGQHMA